MTARVLSLSEFLLARIRDDEAAARRAADGPFSITSTPYGETFGIVTAGGGDYLEEQWFAVDPARVLAECKAKRAIVDDHSLMVDLYEHDSCSRCVRFHAGMDCENEPWPCPTLLAVAAVYADHADYNPEWA